MIKKEKPIFKHVELYKIPLIKELLINSCSKTEASPPAVLTTFLAYIGACFSPKNIGWIFGDSKQRTNLFVATIGPTATGRKGTSAKVIQRISKNIENPEGYQKNSDRKEDKARYLSRAIASGEGLIVNMETKRNTDIDAKNKKVPRENKKALIIDEEISRFLAACSRDGSTASEIVRTLWDSGEMGQLSKSAIEGSGIHISLVFHGTEKETISKLDSLASSNGLANRILWVYTERTQKVAFPKRTNIDHIVKKLNKILKWGIEQRPRNFTFSDAGRKWYEEWYYRSEDKKEIMGEDLVELINRESGYLIRLALIMTCLEKSCIVKKKHLKAAEELIQYCRDSVFYLFGKQQEAKHEKIKEFIKTKGGKATKTQIWKCVFKNNIKKEDLDILLDSFTVERVKPLKGKTINWYS